MALPLAILGSAAISAISSHVGKKSSTWSGEKSKIHKLPTMTSDQRHLFKDVFKHPDRYLSSLQNQPTYQQGSGFLQRILSQDPELMRQFEAPAMRQYNEEIVPAIAERFAGTGSLNSSAFQHAMAQAGTGLAERIASMRAQLGLGAAGQALNYAQAPYNQEMSKLQFLLGTPSFGYQATGGTPGAGSAFTTGLANAGSTALGMYAASQMFGGGGGAGAAQSGGGAPIYPTSAGPTPWGGVPYAPGYVR